MTQSDYTEKQLATLQKLIGIIDNLYVETAGFQENGDNQQHWYNRGYANGVVQQLRELGYSQYVEENIVPDAEDVIAGQELWAWGKAYQHGIEVGIKETTDVIGPLQK